jgi:hypothetical protein
LVVWVQNAEYDVADDGGNWSVFENFSVIDIIPTWQKEPHNMGQK